MTPWTEAAKGELENYFARITPGLEASGADPQEVIDDLRRHLAEEVANAGLSAVTERDLRRLLAKIGAPEQPPAAPPPSPSASPPAVTAAEPRGMGPWAATLLLLAGVVLPAITLGIESVTRMCAAAFFDPMPTIWHSVLILFLVVANGFTWNAVRRGDSRWRTPLGWANAAAMVIAVFYTFIFIPLLLPGAFAIIVFGWGLLPWSPLLALVATVLLRNRLRALDETPGATLPGFWRGALLGVIALTLVEAPVIITRVGMQMAVSESSDTRQAGIGWLRRVGKDDIMLRACYGFTRGAQNMDLRGTFIAGNKRISPEQAREIFYRVNGVPFNSVPAPAVRTGRGAWAALDDWTWDADHGGDKVGGRIRGLTLNSSRLDSVINSDAAWSYTEWTLEFRNDAVRNREARAQILLPPGGVVSRVTLWVNDEEREAAFAGRSHAREAYKKIAVQQRRDPILVTTSGPDRVMMQCFPVPARGGLMKVRIGITAPLTLESRSQGLVRLPFFLERNFSIPDGVEHSIWVESGDPITTSSDRLVGEPSESGGTAIHGQLTNLRLASSESLIRVQRDPDALHAWTADTRAENGSFIRQSIVEHPVTAPTRLFVVVDGSEVMTSHLDELAAAFAQVEGNIPITLLAALDGVATLAAPDADDRGSATKASLGLRGLHPVGGQDNVPALLRARELASKAPGSAILWIHAPQPVLLASVEPLIQAYERKPNGPQILDFSVSVGADRVINKLNGLRALRSVPRWGSVTEDLTRLFDSWATGRTQLAFERTSVASAAEAQAGDAVGTSLHLARLWAVGEVRRLVGMRQVADGIQLAALYQIVTPVSGAVVLENSQQYAQTGLTPVDPQTVPAIPEPSAFSLLLLGAGAFLFARRQR